MNANDMYTVLVNKNNLINKDYTRWLKNNLTACKGCCGDDIFIEKRTFLAYENLRNYLLTQNINIALASAYRTLKRQQEVRDEIVIEYGKEYADKIVAPVGASEHHTGLAIDVALFKNGSYIYNNNDLMACDDIFKNIASSLPEFGFILRYPLGKEGITGYPYEPWHFRYVGREVANYISKNNLTLEQYHEIANNKLK